MTKKPELFAGIGAATAPTFSRDGATVFHLRGPGLPHIWRLDLATGTERRLTSHNQRITLLRRSPVDDLLIYGIDCGGDERQQLLLIDPHEPVPKPRELTSHPGAIHDFGGWSADGTRITYAANERNEAHFDVYIQDITSGIRRRVFDGSNLVSVAGFRPDGTILALLHNRGFGDMALLFLDLASSGVQTFGSPANFQSARWASDGNALLVLSDVGSSDFMRLCRIAPSTGDIAVVYAAPGRDVEAWAIAPDGCALATVDNDGGYSVLRVGPINAERPIVTDLPPGVVNDLAWSSDSTTLAFCAASPTEPPSLWLWREGAAHIAWRPDPLPELAEFVTFEPVVWESFDGRRIPGWLALPRSTGPSEGYPAIVWVHGGPVGQTRPNFRPDIQMLLAQGFAVLMPNVRGSSGYGRTYAESDDVGRRLDSVADLAYARHWLAAHPAINSERIGIMGQSYGGFMVMSAITEYPDLWYAAVNYYGIANFGTLLAGTGQWRRNHRAAEYGDPARDAELLKRISPIHRVDRICAPVLIAHGRRDPRVPIGESDQFVAALQERRKPVTYLTFDSAGHGFIRSEDRRRIYRAVADFFTAHLH
jgi:dipeptidyl aminopeptidase/acylaminoacyl peptidase